MSLDLKKLIDQFLEYSEMDEDFELYNEAGLQHELAWFLRKQFESTKYRLQLERNVSDIGLTLNIDDFIKKEMDIYIYEKGANEKYCVELKFPMKGAFPRRMYQTFEDVNFLESLKLKAGFHEVALLFMTPLKGFREGRETGQIYKYFRDEMRICRLGDSEVPDFIRNEKNKKGELVYRPLSIRGNYPFQWKSFRHQYHYFVITI